MGNLNGGADKGKEAVGGSGGEQSALVDGLLGSLSGGGQGGGLQSLIQSFQEKGPGDIVSSVDKLTPEGKIPEPGEYHSARQCWAFVMPPSFPENLANRRDGINPPPAGGDPDKSPIPAGTDRGIR